MYSLVWRGTTGESGDPLRLLTDDNAVTSVHESSDAGATWQYMPMRRTYYRIYGTYTSPGTTYNVTPQLRHARQRGSASRQQPSIRAINASVPLVNTPELLSAYWRTDFDANPTTLDVTRDGTNDWTMASGTFNVATLVDGSLASQRRTRIAAEEQFHDQHDRRSALPQHDRGRQRRRGANQRRPARRARTPRSSCDCSASRMPRRP